MVAGSECRATITAAKREAMAHGHLAVDLLGDATTAVREAALVCIQRLDGAQRERAVQLRLVERFRDPDWTVRRLSVEALEGVG